MLSILKGIKPLLSCIAWHGILVNAVVASPAKRIDPAGISGALVLAGGLADAAVDRFNELAGGSKMQVAILCLDDGKFTTELAARIVHRSREEELPAPSVTVTKEDPDAVISALETATGVWLLAHDSKAIRGGMELPGMQASVSAVLERGGVVGGHGAGCPAFADDVLALLPGSAISVEGGSGDGGFRLDKVLRERPFLVGYEIDKTAALVVHGRRVTVAGKGEVLISLAPAGERKLRRIKLKGRDAVEDLSALRFAALARSRDPFLLPSHHPPDWLPAR